MLTTKDAKGFISTDSGRPTESSEAEVVRADQHDRAGRHGIGPFVVGSMFVGLLAAVVLVVGPFGGAQEHVISGTALLGLPRVGPRWLQARRGGPANRSDGRSSLLES